MKIKILKIEEIKEYANNPRKVDKSVKALIKSIKQFGFRIPLVVDKDNIIVCGHARVIAAKKLGLKELPCVIVTDLTEEQIRAYRIADNQVAAYATWDEEQLQAELDALGLDLSDYGFEIGKELENSAAEIQVTDFDDTEFDTECPYCGFRFNR